MYDINVSSLESVDNYEGIVAGCLIEDALNSEANFISGIYDETFQSSYYSFWSKEHEKMLVCIVYRDEEWVSALYLIDGEFWEWAFNTKTILA